MPRKFHIGRLSKNYARKKAVHKQKRVPAYQNSCQEQESSLSSTENFTSTESLPESSSSIDNSYESFVISSNDESSQKSSGDND